MERIANEADENFLIWKPMAQRLASKMAMRKYLKEGEEQIKERERENKKGKRLLIPNLLSHFFP